MGKTVLIAEDEPHIVEALSYVLDREGYRVEAVGDGMQALEQLISAPPDMGFHLPGKLLPKMV